MPTLGHFISERERISRLQAGWELVDGVVQSSQLFS